MARHGGSRQRHRRPPAVAARPQILTPQQAQARIDEFTSFTEEPGWVRRSLRRLARLFLIPRRRGSRRVQADVHERHGRERMSDGAYAAKLDARRRRKAARSQRQFVARKNGKW